MDSTRIGFAVCGLGRIGSIHVANVIANTRAELLYVVEEDVAKAEQILHELKADNVRVVRAADIDIVLQDKSVRAVMVCTPTSTHEKCVMDALKAGKAVFCEKPLSHDTEAIVRCYDEAAKQGLPLLCSFNRRFDPGHGKVIEEARKGSLGPIHSITTTSRDSPIPLMAFLKISNGMFHDCASHDIDMVLKITGEPPSTVYSQAHAFLKESLELNDVDCMTITLKFPSGILAVINLDRTSPYGYDQRLEVLGEKAMMISDNPRPTAIQVHGYGGVTLDKCHYSFPQRYAESYKGALDHFIDVIHGKAEIEVTAKDSLLVNKVADACELSFKTQQAVDFTN